MMIWNWCEELKRDHGVTESDPLYPIRRVEIYDKPGTITGVAKGAEPIKSHYAAIVRLEFVPVSSYPGQRWCSKGR